jgi:hypothetical protein
LYSVDLRAELAAVGLQFGGDVERRVGHGFVCRALPGLCAWPVHGGFFGAARSRSQEMAFPLADENVPCSV